MLFFFYSYPPHRYLHSFPTRRSSDLRPWPRRRRSSPRGQDAGEGARKLAVLMVADVPARLLVDARSEEHTSELQSRFDLVCRLLLEKKNLTEWPLLSDVERRCPPALL